MKGRQEPAIERLLSRIRIDDNGCWIWPGCISPEGYGRITDGTLPYGFRTCYTHRVAYEHLVGPIPDDRELDHLCRVRACCNPDHLEPVTRQQNVDRGSGRKGMGHALRTHCKRGHKFTADNTRIGKSGSRFCRACERVRYHEKKVAS